MAHVPWNVILLRNESVFVQIFLQEENSSVFFLYILVLFSRVDPLADHISFNFLQFHELKTSIELFLTALLQARLHDRIHVLNYCWRVLYHFTRDFMCMKTFNVFSKMNWSSLVLNEHREWIHISRGIVSFSFSKAASLQFFLTINIDPYLCVKGA